MNRTRLELLKQSLQIRHQGRGSAATQEMLAIEIGVVERTLRTYISHLIDHGFPVCSADDDLGPRGYWFPATREEAKATYLARRRESLTNIVRASVNYRAALLHFDNAYQPELALGDLSFDEFAIEWRMELNARWESRTD